MRCFVPDEIENWALLNISSARSYLNGVLGLEFEGRVLVKSKMKLGAQN
jgi:hypothetical protein